MFIRKSYIVTTILASLSIIFFMSTCSSKSQAISEGKILAEFEYNGEEKVVTLEELEQEISELPKYKQSKYQDLEGKQEYLTLMIESRLILEMAKAQDWDKDPEILKKVEEYLHQLMVEKITEKEVDDKIKVTEDDLKQYYEGHKEDYVVPEKVKMNVICLEDKELAEKTFKQVREEGKEILKLAKELSDDRKLIGPGSNARNPGVVEFGRNVSKAWKPFVDASFELEKSKMYSEVMELKVQDKKYYLIFSKEEHKSERQKTFDEVRKKVKGKVRKQKKKKRMDEWVGEIRKKAHLKEYSDRIPAPPEKEKAKEKVKSGKSESQKAVKPAEEKVKEK